MRYTQTAFNEVRKDRPVDKNGDPVRTITLQIKGMDDVVRRVSWLEEGESYGSVMREIEKALQSLLTQEGMDAGNSR